MDGRGTERARVLVVDDDDVHRETVVEALSERCDVITAGSIREARALLRSVSFDAVVLDLSLRDGSGDELFDDLRGALAVVVTAHGPEAPEVAPARRRAFRVAHKPVDPAILLSSVITAAGVSRLRRAGKGSGTPPAVPGAG
jgi:DNA-binding NtrC family response regulator